MFLSAGQTALAEIIADDRAKIDEQLKNDENKIGGEAVVLIYSDKGWSGSISGSDQVSASRKGPGNAKVQLNVRIADFFGMDKGIYSLSIQNDSGGGHLTVAVIQDGKLLKGDSTTAGYGVVSFAGECA